MGRKSDDAEMKCVGENLWLRHKRYYARLKKSGKDIWKSLKTSDRNFANARLLEFKAEIGAHTVNPAKGKAPTFKYAAKVLLQRAKLEIKRHSTWTTLQSSLNRATESMLGPMLINKITANHVKDYLHQRAKKQSGRTANHDLTAIRKIFKFAVERGWKWDNPCKNIQQFPHKEKRVPVPSVDEVKSVLTVMRDGRMREDANHAANFIELLVLSGLRLAEAQALRWEDVDLNKGILIVREGKGGKSRVVDLSPSLREFIVRCSEKSPASSGLIYPKRKKQPYNPKRALKTACQIAEVPRFSFHGLRHAWATELVKAGIDFGTIAQWAGHNDGGLLIPKRYGRHMRRDHMQAAAQKATFCVTQTVDAAVAA